MLRLMQRSLRRLWFCFDSQDSWKGQEVEFTVVSDGSLKNAFQRGQHRFLLKESGLTEQLLWLDKARLTMAPKFDFSIVSKPEWLEVNPLMKSDNTKSLSG